MKILNRLALKVVSSFLLFLCLCANPLTAQVEVDQNSNVGIGRAPIVLPAPPSTPTYTPKLSILGRIDIRYPGQYLTNIAMGSQVGNPSMSGAFNLMLGIENGKSLTDGNGNILLGKWVGRNIVGGNSNVCIGSITAEKLTEGEYNFFMGTFTGNNFNGNYNMALGFGAGTAGATVPVCTGSDNVLIGKYAGSLIQGGATQNVAIGPDAMDGLTTGNDNVAIGNKALSSVGTGRENVAIGPYAGENAPGIKNVFIGTRAGRNETGNAKLYIDNSSTAQPLIYGDFNTNYVLINGSFEVLGNLDVNGSVNANVKNFKIDHPLDPENKSLVFASIEAPEMINLFRGNATTDDQGFATVTLPDYFSAANVDCSYHLTCIGVFAQAIVSKKVIGNQFVIQTDQPNVEVSWQVLAKRADTWAKENPLEVEQQKQK